MSDEPAHVANGNGTTATHHSDYHIQSTDPNPPTIASFAPISSSPASRSRFQVHQKSPLLVATPPQVTRALSQSYPYVKAANYVLGLLTWTTPDPWESFLVVAAFWAAALYGDVVLRFAGNVFIVVVLILGMFLRRYYDEPTSTTLDEILETLNTLTTRMNIFFDPFLQLTRWLSTTKTATTATTRPALTTLFTRILLTTPLWLALSVYPTRIITARRIVLLMGTLVLSWHSRPAKVSRTVLWRSQLIRLVCSRLTGLSLMPPPVIPALPPRHVSPSDLKHANGSSNGNGSSSSSSSTTTHKSHPTATSPGTHIAAAPRGNPDNIHPEVSTPLTASTAGASPGVKFTFAIYENQRRWLGVGWTSSLFAYERAPFTDEHLQPAPAPAEFVLPVTGRGSGVRWRWVPGEDWRVEGANGGGGGGKKQEVKDKVGLSGESGEGWVYYDNKWRDGRRGVDGWGKYTRRRKWYRNAELVEDMEDADAAEMPPAEVKVMGRENPEVVVTGVEGEVVKK
ncbi:integral peroxisomal membrane peroxin [Morchella conica CCBAS932]|uniref:Integral peroxisomal membrane peroxin n=1 Tax=Morchella conica CCBAS932 TaxID=1392247 RepID=A0A3N4KGL5_9PEZI|nr:integral peroxisomal membrane peroxin [Morchella conica CCBAS932]